MSGHEMNFRADMTLSEELDLCDCGSPNPESLGHASDCAVFKTEEKKVEAPEQTMTFFVKITCRGRQWPFKVIRDEIRKAVMTVSGLSFEDIQAGMDPDPYAFDDPDDPSKGAY